MEKDPRDMSDKETMRKKRTRGDGLGKERRDFQQWGKREAVAGDAATMNLQRGATAIRHDIF